MKVNIVGCYECPFQYSTPYDQLCTHPIYRQGRTVDRQEARKSGPPWCPLKQFTVTLVKNQ